MAASNAVPSRKVAIAVLARDLHTTFQRALVVSG
jgi:hypothetical protein